jgi:hypothetical protein
MENQTPAQPPRARRGRPPVRAATSAVIDLNALLEKFDPLDVLRRIAVDPNAPFSSRVEAAKALLRHQGEANPMRGRTAKEAINQRAVALLNGVKRGAAI